MGTYLQYTILNQKSHSFGWPKNKIKPLSLMLKGWNFLVPQTERFSQLLYERKSKKIHGILLSLN